MCQAYETRHVSSEEHLHSNTPTTPLGYKISNTLFCVKMFWNTTPHIVFKNYQTRFLVKPTNVQRSSEESLKITHCSNDDLKTKCCLCGLPGLPLPWLFSLFNLIYISSRDSFIRSTKSYIWHLLTYWHGNLNNLTYLIKAICNLNNLDRVRAKPASTKHCLLDLCWLADHDIIYIYILLFIVC